MNEIEKRVKEIIRENNIEIKDKISFCNFALLYMHGQRDSLKEQLDKATNENN